MDQVMEAYTTNTLDTLVEIIPQTPMHRYHSRNSDGDRSGSIVIISRGRSCASMTEYPCDTCPQSKRCTQQQHDVCPMIEQWCNECYNEHIKARKSVWWSRQEMQFSDQDIIRAAVKAASHAKSDGIDLKDIYLELLDCTAYSKIYRFRYEMVSRQRMINLSWTNG